MSDLYDTLDVPRDAAPEDIKKAYRRKAQKAHPDAGGDAEQFHAVQKAYEVLADPKARARYDETGSTDEMPTTEEQAREAITQVMLQMVDQLDVDFTDFKDELAKHFKEAKSKILADIAKGKKQMARYQKAAKKIKRKAGENFLARALDGKAAQCQQAINQATAFLANCDAAQELLKDFEYEVTPPPVRGSFVQRPDGTIEEALRAFARGEPIR